MLIKFISIEEYYGNLNSAVGQRSFLISEVYINPNFIITMKEDLKYIELSISKKLPDGFARDQKFTRISLNKGNMGQEITVIGDVVSLIEKINGVKNGN